MSKEWSRQNMIAHIQWRTMRLGMPIRGICYFHAKIGHQLWWTHIVVRIE